MPPKNPRLPRLDLPRFGIIEMALFLSYPWSDKLEPLFGALVNEREFVSSTPYNVKRHQHLIFIVAWRQDGGESDIEKRLMITIRFDASQDVVHLEVPKTDRREKEIVQVLLALTEQTTIHCDVVFAVDPVDTSTLWFPLPTLVGVSPDAYEIRGVRGAKLSGDSDSGAEFGFIMDRPTGETVFLELRFSFLDRFTMETPREAIDRGATIARQLVGTTPRRRKPE